jgi:hypothetical protein
MFNVELTAMEIGQVVYSKSTGYPFEITDIRLAKDFEDGDEDIVCVKKHKSYPGYADMEPWERKGGGMWPMDWISEGQLELFRNE